MKQRDIIRQAAEAFPGHPSNALQWKRLQAKIDLLQGTRVDAVHALPENRIAMSEAEKHAIQARVLAVSGDALGMEDEKIDPLDQPMAPLVAAAPMVAVPHQPAPIGYGNIAPGVQHVNIGVQHLPQMLQQQLAQPPV